METYIIHHDDADGIMSAAIVKKRFPDATPIPYKYGQKIELLNVKDMQLIVVDCSLDNMDYLAENAGELIWIDHHSTAMNKYPALWQNPAPEIGFKGVLGLRVIGIAACELCWEFFFTDEQMPRAVKLIGDRDVWKFEYGNETKFFHEAIKTSSFEQYLNFLEMEDENLNFLLDLGGKIFATKLIKWQEYSKQAEIILYNKEITYSLNIPEEDASDISMIADYMLTKETDLIENKKPRVVLLYYKNKEGDYKVSLRSQLVNVRVIAENYGGGGHDLAAGYSVKYRNF